MKLSKAKKKQKKTKENCNLIVVENEFIKRKMTALSLFKVSKMNEEICGDA